MNKTTTTHVRPGGMISGLADLLNKAATDLRRLVGQDQELPRPTAFHKKPTAPHAKRAKSRRAANLPFLRVRLDDIDGVLVPPLPDILPSRQDIENLFDGTYAATARN